MPTAAAVDYHVQRVVLLDIVIGDGTAGLKLLAREHQHLHVSWGALLVGNVQLDRFDQVEGIHLKGHCLAGQSLNKDLHDDQSN